MDKSYEEFLAELERDGYIAGNGAPLKCYHCDSKKLVDKNHYMDGHILIEIDVTCGECGKEAGHWSYGSWIL